MKAREPQTYDLVVIGGGPAGTCGANVAAIFGKRVALVEKCQTIGGAGINTGTVPSKTLRETALALSGWRSRKLFGVDLSLRREATIADFMRHQQSVSHNERGRTEQSLEANRVTLIYGTAQFVDPRTICVATPDGGELLLRGETLLVATGSSPRRPPEFPFEDERIHDSDELLHLKSLPKRLAMVGAGVIGSEYACTFAAMGVDVHLIDGRDELLPVLDAEISRALADAMAADGIHFHWNESVAQCDASAPGDLRLALASGKELRCDTLLVCAGRTSNTADLNLAAAGIELGERGLIPVDAHYRSQTPHIYAAGDVIGPPALAGTSMEQARIAMCHAFGILLKEDLSPVLPIGIYTIPEASMVGETEESLAKAGVDYIAGRARYADIPRGEIIGDDKGFLKLLFRRNDMRLLGVHICGEHATEVVHIGLMALLLNAGADVFNRACFNYPTLGDLYKYATYDAIYRRNQGERAVSSPVLPPQFLDY